MDHRIPEDDVRERFFARECLNAAQEHHANAVVCGDMHVEALKQKLEAEGQFHDVTGGSRS